MSGEFDVAQICLNGHLITDEYNGSPERRKNYCDRCGEKTIFECPCCNQKIRGDYFFFRSLNRLKSNQFHRQFPYYCDNCGEPFPWTIRKLEAIRDIVKELKITKNEKELLDTSLQNLVRDTPGSPAAVLKWKKVLSKVEETAYKTIEKLFIEIMSETVKKALFG
jgi:hypothetical protein